MTTLNVSRNGFATRERRTTGSVEHKHFSATTIVVIAAAVCIALLGIVNMAHAGAANSLQGIDSAGVVR